MTEKREQYALTRTHATSIVETFDDVARIGKAMAASGYFSDAQGAAQAIVKILAGREMGFGPFAAMNGVHIIQGKPSVGANLMAAAVKNHPSYDYRVTHMGDDAVSITFYQNGDELGESGFTMADANEAKYYDKKKGGWIPLANKHNWRNYPRNMLFARAISNGVRWYCPDVFAGNAVYTPDELGADVDANGDVIDAGLISTSSEAEPEPDPEPNPEAEIETNDHTEPTTESEQTDNNGWQAFWDMYHNDAKPVGIPRKHAENIAKKYGDPSNAVSSLADAIASKQE